ncbi:MAG: hypothetical protein BWX66_00866 [Deltaproteobacteria bacterium ADurb.Bin058]|nr:MAG: hypothetical protein BWX66_00866 [Deltaproteobacteria bacterium ADurb.Bin058]
MVLSIIAALAALTLATASIIALGNFFAGRKLLKMGPQFRSGLVVAPTTYSGANPLVIRVLAAAADEGPIDVCWAVTPNDTYTAARVESVQKQFPRADLKIVNGELDFISVPATVLATQGLSCANDGVVGVIHTFARPSSKDPGTILAAANGPSLVGPVAMCPAPSANMEPGEVLAARGLCDQAPILFSIHGAAGLWPLFVSAPLELWQKAAQQPLAMNRPNALAMLAASVDRRYARLLPTGVGIAPNTIRPLRRAHFQWLIHFQPLHSAATAASLTAIPGSLLAWLLAGSPSATSLALVALGLALASRALVSFTWTSSILGSKTAFQTWLMSPWRDFRTLISFIAAAVNKQHETSDKDETPFRIEKGGILVPKTMKK